MKKKNHIECMGYPVFNSTLDHLPTSKKILISTINQYSYCIAEKDTAFKKALMKSDILLPDGIGIVVAARLLKNREIKKIAGADLHEHLLKKLDQEKGSCFYLGSSEETLEKIKARVAKEYPNIRLGTHSPPFKPSFSFDDTAQMLNAVNTFRPDVLFVGMTAPKQEKWSYDHKNALDVQIICSIGAVFDFYAGTVKRPNKIWINMGIEWLGRLLKEPKRMWKRYIYYGFIFGFYLVREKSKSIFSRQNRLI
jgi:N-acetylglucosaminyldiphosphoundecaprenol N-acetyl-beta-D-mannosaminyltransferase